MQRKNNSIRANAMPKVLIIDDDPDWRRLCEVVLGIHEIEVKQCAEPNLALDLVEQLMPDLIVLDVNMVHMDGFQLLWHLNNGATTAHIPVIMMSTRAKAMDVAWAQRLGAIRYIVKNRELPAVVEDLDRLAAEMLGGEPSAPSGDATDAFSGADRQAAVQTSEAGP